jgi:hypothetical protein
MVIQCLIQSDNLKSSQTYFRVFVNCIARLNHKLIILLIQINYGDRRGALRDRIINGVD